MVTVDIRNHMFVPEHILLSEKEGKEVLKELGITRDQLPKILTIDPVIRLIGGKQGDIVKIIRESPTAGVEIGYRIIIEP